MALTGPADRTITIDNAAASPTDFTANITSITGVGEVENAIQELTGPGDVKPVHLPTGFASSSDIVVTFEGDLGGSPDPIAEFYETQTGSRTFLMSYKTGWTFSVETYIVSAKPTVPNKELTMLEVTFRPTGTWTIT